MDTIGVLQLNLTVSAGQDDLLIITNQQGASYAIKLSDLAEPLTVAKARVLESEDGLVVITPQAVSDHFASLHVESHNDLEDIGSISHAAIDEALDFFLEEHTQAGWKHLEQAAGANLSRLNSMCFFNTGSFPSWSEPGLIIPSGCYIIFPYNGYWCSLPAGTYTATSSSYSWSIDSFPDNKGVCTITGREHTYGDTPIENEYPQRMLLAYRRLTQCWFRFKGGLL